MHRVPTGRRFGGPEIALLAVALAFAVPLTAWWHGLYQQPPAARLRANVIAPPTLVLTDGAKTHSFAAFGYLVNADSNGNPGALPLSQASPVPICPVPSAADPNQALLLAVAAFGTAAAGVYSIGVYPALRR